MKLGVMLDRQINHIYLDSLICFVVHQLKPPTAQEQSIWISDAFRNSWNFGKM